MSEQQLFIAAVVALWGLLVLLIHKMLADAALAQQALVDYMDKALESCAKERGVYMGLMQGILQEMSENRKEHTTLSKEMYHRLEGLERKRE